MTQPESPSILASQSALHQRPWWPDYQRRRPATAALSDTLFLGRFCRWLDGRELDPEACTPADLDEYAATLTGFRDEVRGGYLRAASELVATLGDPREVAGEGFEPSKA